MSQQALTNASVRRVIFSTSTINDAIQAHQDIKNWNFGKPVEELSVFDLLCDCTGFRVRPSPAIKNALQSKGRVQWTNFGFRGGPECTQMVSRQEFIRHLAPADIDILKNPNPNIEDLERISFYVRSANILFAFKSWLIIRNPDQPWRGIQATTSPVVNTLKQYWKGVFGIDLRENSDFQYALADELNLDALELNTRLWVMGR